MWKGWGSPNVQNDIYNFCNISVVSDNDKYVAFRNDTWVISKTKSYI